VFRRNHTIPQLRKKFNNKYLVSIIIFRNLSQLIWANLYISYIFDGLATIFTTFELKITSLLHIRKYPIFVLYSYKEQIKRNKIDD